MRTFPRLSVLEVAAVGPGVTAAQAFRWTTEVARAADRLGYYRLWVAEHHAVADIGSSAPSVLVAHLAAHTRRLRIGSGGVMLRNHAPLAVAEQFSLLQALHPERIDLGIGRGRGADPTAASALWPVPETATSNFEAKVHELMGLLHRNLPTDHPRTGVVVSPQTEPPPIFLLASSEAGARFAASRGLPLAYAHHLAPAGTVAALAAYRDAFEPSPELGEPYSIITAAVACASSSEEAERSAVAACAVRIRRVLAGRQGRVPDVAELTSPHLSDEEAVVVAESLGSGSFLIGDSTTVRTAAEALCRGTGADELMVCTMEYDGPARIRTLTELCRGTSDAGRLGRGEGVGRLRSGVRSVSRVQRAVVEAGGDPLSGEVIADADGPV